LSFNPSRRNVGLPWKAQSPSDTSGRWFTLSKSFCLFAESRKNLSASDRERRDEENRRLKRKDDVIIGKTSAKQGEKDFYIDPKATEQEWLRQASKVDQEIFRLTEVGMRFLNSVRM
jgi:hypothetical protein